jgi:hypothetical protein
MGIALRSVAFTRKTVTCAHHDRTAVGQIAVARAEVRLNCGESYGPSPECGQDEDRGVANIETDSRGTDRLACKVFSLVPGCHGPPRTVKPAG